MLYVTWGHVFGHIILMMMMMMWVDAHMAKICYALLFKGHSLGGSSIASLYVSK